MYDNDIKIDKPYSIPVGLFHNLRIVQYVKQANYVVSLR